MRGKLVREGDLFAVCGLVVILVVFGSPVVTIGVLMECYTWMWGTLAGMAAMYVFGFAIPGMIATRKH